MQISRTVFRIVLVGLIVFGIGHSCAADTVVFSNLGTGGDLYEGLEGWSVTPGPGPSFLAPAFAFTPSSTVIFSEIDIALSYFPGNYSPIGNPVGVNVADVELMSDVSGQPGADLESWRVSVQPESGSCCVLTELFDSNGVLLESGTQYWINVFPITPNTNVDWSFNSTGDTGTLFEDFAFTANDEPVGAFEVQGASATPEPGTLPLLGTGLLGLAGLMWRRFRRSAI